MSKRKLIERLREVSDECAAWPHWMKRLAGIEGRSGEERRIDGPDGFITGLYKPIDHDKPITSLGQIKYAMKYEEKRTTKDRRIN